MKKKELSKTAFIVLSHTWGLPLTLVGGVVALGLRLTGNKPKKFGWCRYFEVGKGWGGCEFGPVFVKAKDEGKHICEHEFGHAIQNCYFGPLMPFAVNLPSTFRYWYRRISLKNGKRLKTRYDDIWFEGQASRLGKKYADLISGGEENDNIFNA